MNYHAIGFTKNLESTAVLIHFWLKQKVIQISEGKCVLWGCCFSLPTAGEKNMFKLHLDAMCLGNIFAVQMAIFYRL